jgi:polyhydroxybutyrate depolymerase
MKALLTAFCLVLFSSYSIGQINGTIQHNGITRDYIVYLPTTFNSSQSLPLVFVLHGFTQTASAIMSVTGFNDLAETNNFIAVYPNGVGNAWNTNTGFPGGSTADDVGFIGALIDEFVLLYNIDTTRVYSCGFSAGGYMSHRLACESPRCFAAIASVSGTMSNNAYNDCNPVSGTPVLQIHGTSDNIVSYNGGFGGKSVSDVINKWVSVNGCPASPIVTALPDLNTTDNSTVERFEYTPCSSSKPVELLKVTGGGHQWPGTTSALGGLGNINMDIVASQEIWDFFLPFNCPSAATSIGVQPSRTDIKIKDEGHGIFSVVFDNQSAPSDGFTYTVRDIMGRQILSNTSSDNLVTISLSGFSQGIYSLSLEWEGSFQSYKLMNR